MKRFKNYRFLLLMPFLFLVNCGYNTIQELDEEVNTQMAEVINQYKRRADLIPPLVQVVQGYAEHEKDVFVEVSKARGGVGGITISPEIANNPDAFKRFVEAQNNLGGALQRLIVVSEKYPELKADTGFRDLQSQLEGTENRIAVARKRYIDSVKNYNLYVRKFPGIIWATMFGYKVKSSFTVENEDSIKKLPNEISNPPEVKFNK